jgi:hypothetical protein
MTTAIGIEIVEIYTRVTGITLPREFWIYYNDWCKAVKENDVSKKTELRWHPNVEQYSEWMTKVKEIVNKEIIKRNHNKKHD